MSTKIEWCTETYNPIIGCSKVSTGCQNCYAERMAHRLANMNTTSYYMHVVKSLNYGTPMVTTFPEWNGKTHFVESALEKPLHWKKPRMIFVCSMGDLFHESVPFEWIDKVMAIISSTPQHTYQILTKRPERMKLYVSYLKDKNHWTSAYFVEKFPNIWLGVTAENQKQADKRIPTLLKIPAAKRFVSIEPMLGAVNISEYLHESICTEKVRKDEGCICAYNLDDVPTEVRIDQIICGGESGPKARPMHPDWARSLRDQCIEAKVPFFFKQFGEWAEVELNIEQKLKDKYIVCGIDGKEYIMTSNENAIYMKKVGKKKAGHLLDGKEWREMP